MITILWTLVVKGWKSKTVLFGFLLSMLGALQMWLPNLQAILTPEIYATATTVIGFIVIVLRYLTTNSLLDK